jgi:hypothetical protein
MEKNEFNFLEPISEDMLRKLKGGFGVYTESSNTDQGGSVSVTVKANSTCKCKCTISGGIES